MSLNKRKSKQLAPIDSTHKRQSLQKAPLKLKRIQPPPPILKPQSSKLKLKPLPSKTSSTSTRPFQQFQKFQKLEKPKQQNQMMSTFMTQSSLFTSYYQTETSGWIKPSDYLTEISAINLLEDVCNSDELEFKLSDNAKKNEEKIEKLFSMVGKWVGILRKAIFYTESQKTNSNKISEEIKFWKVLSKKFDELEYEFNDSKSQKLTLLIHHYQKITPQYTLLSQQFLSLKAQVCSLTIHVKKLYLSLEGTIEPLVLEFQQSESILTSLELLREILSNMHHIFQDYKVIEGRKAIVYRKLNVNLVKCLIASNINPSTIRDNISLIDPALSFLSNYISLMQQDPIFNGSEIMAKAEYQQQILGTLLEMSTLFEHIERQKGPEELVVKGKELRGMDYGYNIFDEDNNDRWFQTLTVLEEARKYWES